MARGDLIVQAIDNGLPADQCHTINAIMGVLGVYPAKNMWSVVRDFVFTIQLYD